MELLSFLLGRVAKLELKESGRNNVWQRLIYIFLFPRNIDPPIWYDTDVKLFEIQRV